MAKAKRKTKIDRREEIDCEKKKHAIVLSGGGANGAYEIGVLKALVSGRAKTTAGEPLDPDLFLGTSVGAFNAAFLASQWDSYGNSAVGHLENIWLDDIAEKPLGRGNGAFRIRGNPLELLNPFSYIPDPVRPIASLVEDTATVAWDGLKRAVNIVTDTRAPLLERATRIFNFSTFVAVNPLGDLVRTAVQYDKVRISSKQLRVVATNWAMGQSQVFTEHDMTDQLGPQVILASTAIPGIFPVQTVGSQPFVDGGVLMNTPLMPAVIAGADVLHVITLNPSVEKIGLENMDNTLATAWRQQVISWVKAVDRNVWEIWSKNRTLELGELAIRELPDKEVTLDIPPDCDHPGLKRLKGDLTVDVERSIWEMVREYKPITVYVYRPLEDLGGPLGLLDFSRDRLEHLVEAGFNDAVEFIANDATYVPPYPIRNREIERALDEQELERVRGEQSEN